MCHFIHRQLFIAKVFAYILLFGRPFSEKLTLCDLGELGDLWVKELRNNASQMCHFINRQLFIAKVFAYILLFGRPFSEKLTLCDLGELGDLWVKELRKNANLLLTILSNLNSFW